MKYYIDKGTNQLEWFGYLFGLVFPVGAIISLLWTNEVDSRLVYGCVISYPLVFVLGFIDRRSTSYAKITASTVDAYSMFGKLYCSVSMEQTVYFISFESYRAKTKYKGKYKPFIALSNQPFRYQDPTKVVNFIVRYDLHTIVVLPYDDRTKPLLPVDNWIQVA